MQNIDQTSYIHKHSKIKYNMKFLTIKKRTLCIILISIFLICSILGICYAVQTASSPKPEYSIVIDAGHGGRDGGAVGSSGVTESELNLIYAKQLASLCDDFGIGVTMTRSDMNGLYDESASNKKKSEMERRKNIINSSGADIMISIHMNSFPLSSSNGAYVFYAKGNNEGYSLAKSVQTSLCQSFDNARQYVSVGDYFVLNYSTMPSVLVECGFLSNPEEETNLQSQEYCERFCYSLLVGILSYFQMS